MRKFPPRVPANKPRVKGIYIGAPACFALELECKNLHDAFCGGDDFGGIYVVGSCLEKPDWRDVDVRLIMADRAFYALFPGSGQHWEFDPRWLVMTVAISERLSRVTGLPVDFQFQPQSHANDRHRGRRNSIGMRFARSKD